MNGFARDIQLTWYSNSEADLAGYRVHVGTESRAYTTHVDVGKDTTHVLSDLEDHTEYFFALTAYDTAGNFSDYSREVNCVLGDTEPPVVLTVLPVSLTEIHVVFDETVDAGTAQDSDNYRIDNGIGVNGAVLQFDRRTVSLLTDPFERGREYTVSIEGITDLAIPPNRMVSADYTFTMSEVNLDTIPPTITLVHLVSATELNIHFSEALDVDSAVKIENFAIDNGIVVFSASMISENTLRLKTSGHVSDAVYAITVSNITDNSPRRNVIAPNSSYAYSYSPGDVVGPMISLVDVTDKNTLLVMFNEPVEENSATDMNNYTINGGVEVVSAEMDQTGQIIHLRTTAHEPNRLYLLYVRDLYDNSPYKNAVQPNSSYAYVFEPDDIVSPTIQKVVVQDATHIKVFFSEAVDMEIAQKTGNYAINNGIQILNALADATGRIVVLETSAHISDAIYVLTVNGIVDLSEVGNQIAANSSYVYTYEKESSTLGPTIVEVKSQGANSLVVFFNKTLDFISATNTSNYRMSGDVAVLSAKLSQSQMAVKLETSLQSANTLYTLTVNSVIDQEGRSILPSSTYVFYYQGEDAVGPVISLVKCVDAENMDILFSERVARTGAENTRNYAVSGGIVVHEAHLDGSNRVVHLHTSRHEPNHPYIITVNNVYDESVDKNVISPNSSYFYLYEPADGVGPTIAMVRRIGPDQLEVSFSEPVDSGTASNIRNYHCEGLEIKSVFIGDKSHVVVLKTEPMTEGRIYILHIDNIVDEHGNRMAANSSYSFSGGTYDSENSPRIEDLQLVNDSELIITFNCQIGQVEAQRKENYLIQGGIAVLNAELDADKRRVRLTTTPHMERFYILLVSNINRLDDPAQRLQANTPFFYFYRPQSLYPPFVENVNILGETLIDVEFSRPIDRLSGENRHNYLIDDITVLSAALDATGRHVYLETSRHRAGGAYTLTVSGFGADSGDLFTDTAIAYTYMPALRLSIESDTETMLSYLDVGKEYYVDRNYLITDIPDGLLHSRLIMTLNDDKDVTDTRYLSLTLSQPAFVYVAYDSRASAVPLWLRSSYVETNLTVGVTDNAERLSLWKGYFQGGTVSFGGNHAAGARDVKSMYIVLIRESREDDVFEGGQLDQSFGETSSVIQSVVLHQNFPNPFNPITTIGFDLPSGKEVKLSIYDILGRQVRILVDGSLGAGQHHFIWEGTNSQGVPVAAGVYFYKLEAWRNGEQFGIAFKENYLTRIQKMTLLR